MKFKTRVIALLAGSALALSCATGALADTTSTATVTLSPNSSAQGCTLDSVTIPAFAATWNGTSYSNPPSETMGFYIGYDSAVPGETGRCTVSMWGTDFQGQSDTSMTFGIDRLLIGTGVSVPGNSGTPLTIANGWPQGGGTSPISLNLTGVTVPPDTYTSTITFTVTTG